MSGPVILSLPLTPGLPLPPVPARAVWGVYNPAWLTALNGTASAATLQAALTEHVTGVITRLAPRRLLSWDVVNEPFSDAAATTPVFKTTDPWFPALADYVEIALRTARAADPRPLLFLNEYGAEGAGFKADKVYETAQALKARGVPLDGIGLQMHISVSSYPDPKDVAANIARLGALGLDVHITEMDVRCPPPCDEDAQAAVYGNLLAACLCVAGPGSGRVGSGREDRGAERVGGRAGGCSAAWLTPLPARCAPPCCARDPPPPTSRPQLAARLQVVRDVSASGGAGRGPGRAHGRAGCCSMCGLCRSEGLPVRAAPPHDPCRAPTRPPSRSWGLTDRYTWLYDFNNPNHTDVKPLPFDVNYNAKPAVAEMLAVFAAHRAGLLHL